MDKHTIEKMIASYSDKIADSLNSLGREEKDLVEITQAWIDTIINEAESLEF